MYIFDMLEKKSWSHIEIHLAILLQIISISCIKNCHISGTANKRVNRRDASFFFLERPESEDDDVKMRVHRFSIDNG
jgi:hypothetical protein